MAQYTKKKRAKKNYEGLGQPQMMVSVPCQTELNDPEIQVVMFFDPSKRREAHCELT